jgi:hypothetical protein
MQFTNKLTFVSNRLYLVPSITANPGIVTFKGSLKPYVGVEVTENNSKCNGTYVSFYRGADIAIEVN